MTLRLAVLFGACLWGAAVGWAVASAAAQPGTSPSGALLVYGAVACFGPGFGLGSALRGGWPERLALRAAGLTGVVALAVKALAPSLAAWAAVLLAAAVFGALAGLARTR